MRAWILSQHYDCPEHDIPWPVGTAYGVDHYCPGRQSSNNQDFDLISMEVSPIQVEAMKEDPRVIYCGRNFDPPPAKLLEVYKSKLDPSITYQVLGQVIARLAQFEPAFYARE